MLSVQQMLAEITAALRNVIAPAITEPYPKAQAYMAAVILELLSGQVEERRDIAAGKEQALRTLFEDLAKLLDGKELARSHGVDGEARLCQIIEQLYAERSRLGEKLFTAANRRVRQALRQLLDQELKVVGNRREE
jgi:flagellar biosynthesis/type III secretory pathway protein FliH